MKDTSPVEATIHNKTKRNKKLYQNLKTLYSPSATVCRWRDIPV